MDRIEHEIFQLGQQAKALAEGTKSEEAKKLLREAGQILKRAASAHHTAT